MIHPCDNCGETDEHTCVIDGVEYGPWDDWAEDCWEEEDYD